MRTLTVLGLLAAVWGALRTEGFSVQGPGEPLVARPGDEVLLPCSVDSAVPLQGLEVEWLRTDPDTLVLLFSGGESRPESQDQSYRGRAELFPQEIPRGNFSLRLANFTVEDTGVYRCAVYTKEDSGQTTVELKEQERLAVSGASEPVAAYAGGEVVLSCSVDTNVPLQELEVEWLKTDSTILVHMFSEGESRPESQHQRYRGRAEFITERIPNGDFSLRLKDIRTEDKGEYMCIVHTDSGSANTTAELKELGFSTAHIWILLLALSALGVVLLTSVPACQFLLQNRETSWRWPCCLVNCVAPGLLLSVAFILWGQTEGFLQESVTCATVSVLRVLLVSMMASYSHWYPGNLGRILKRFSVPFVFFAFLTVVMSVILAEYFKTRAPDTAGKQTIGILSGLVFLSSLFGIVVKGWMIFCRKHSRNCLEYNASFHPLLFSMMAFMFFIAVTQLFIIGYFVGIGVAALALCVAVYFKSRCDRQGACGSLCQRITFVVLLMLLITLTWLWMSEVPDSDRGRLGRICEVTFLWILLSPEAYKRFSAISARAQVAQVGVYMLGSSVLPAVSAIALTAELILKAEKGRRTLTDLRLVVLPCQILLLVCWLVLLMCVDYKVEKLMRNRSRCLQLEPMSLQHSRSRTVSDPHE